MHVDLYGHACPDASRPNQCYGNKKVRLKKKKNIFHRPMHVKYHENDEKMIKMKKYFITIRSM